MIDVRGAAQVGGTTIGASNRDDDGGREVRGSRNGEVVVLEKDAMTLAEELAPELGSEAVSEEMESELGREERRITSDEEILAVSVSAGVEGEPEALDDLLDRKEEIEALGREMQAEGVKDAGDILQFLQENLGERKGERGPNRDPTLQYGALTIIERMFAAEGDEEMAAGVGGAAARLLAESAHEINKGVVVSEAATLYAANRFGSVSELRALYLDEVVAHKGILTSFNNIVEKYSEQGFRDALAFLLRAAGDDLATMTSNNDRMQQKEIVDNLYQLEVLNTVRERTDGVLAQIGRHFGLASDATAQGVMRETFGMLDNPVTMVEPTVTKLARQIVPESIEGRIAFLREYRGLAGLMPLKVFDEADRGAGGGLRLRERFSDAIVQAQDVADAEEQHKLASQ